MSTINQTRPNPAGVSLLLTAADGLNYLQTAIITSRARSLERAISYLRGALHKSEKAVSKRHQPPTPHTLGPSQKRAGAGPGAVPNRDAVLGRGAVPGRGTVPNRGHRARTEGWVRDARGAPR